jgi:two-component system sensor histidine kinase CpxA
MTFSKGLSKLNPAQTLYGRIFLWFWLATLVMVASSIWLSRQFSNDVEFRPVKATQLKELNMAKGRIEKFLVREFSKRRFSQKELERILVRIGKRSQRGLMLIESTSQEIIYGFPEHILPDTQPFLDLIEQSSPLNIRVGAGLFIGPTNIKIDGSDYLLFMGRPAPQGALGQIRRGHPFVLLGLALAISALLCFLLAWSLLKPIKQLQRASREMAAGDLNSRVGSASERIDEIGQLGRDFNNMAEQVTSLLQSHKRLLADISHELRSPLARLQLAIGIAQQQSDIEQSHTSNKQLERIEKESLQIEHMLAQILILSRLENQQQIRCSETIVLKPLLERVIDDAQFEADAVGKNIKFESCESGVLVGDESLLGSAIENVLRNAVKYATQEIMVKVAEKKSFITIEVSDDGPGIVECELIKVFEPFYRVSTARDRNSGGVGLGLAIAYRAIHKHQGNIEAVNKAEGGLIVRISLPK